MSALAARRAAAAAAASTPPNAASSPAPARRSATSKAGRSRQTKATRPDVQSANVNDETAADHNGRPAVSMVDDAPGPSKRPRTGQSGPQRYLGPLNAAVSDIKGKGKGTRKRAFSPSAPMMSSEDEDECKEDGKGGGSDEDQDVGSDTDDPDQEADQLDEAVTPYGTPGAWRPRSTENIAAVSRFVPRKGHNFELLSSGKLDTLGVKGQGNGMLLSLAAEEDIYLAGTFSITPIQGRVSFYGTILSPTTDDRAYPVYSPVSHAVSAISFSDTSSSTTSQLLSQIRLPDTLSLSGRALILVRGTATGLDGMRGGAIPGFATAWGDEKGWMGVKGVHSIPGSIIAPCYPYQQPETWTDALDQIYRDATDYPVQTAPIVLVKGPKRSGKSTIARTALNTLLQTYERVAWLECDLGQGEFGCGGVIGLWVLDTPVYGPAFTHPRIPRRAHFLGTYTPLTCPDEYIAAIQHLLDVYRYELQDRALTAGGQSTLRRTDATPLVINTQGWVKGLGEELLRSIEGATRATHVLAFDKSPSDGDDMERNGWTSSPTLGMTDLPPSYLGEEPRVFSLDQAPVTPLQQRYTAADYRNLSTLAYLHANLASNGEPTWDFTSPMLAMPPFEVAISPEGPIRSVYMQGEGAEGISIADLPLALNGALVALVDNQSEASLAADTATYVQGRPLPPLDSVNYLGLAVIRAVVPAETGAISAHKIHVLAPLPADVLTRCNAIIRNGAMELPTAAMLDWRDTAVYSEEGLAGVPWADVPFFDTDTRGVGIEKRKIRRNLMRKGM